MIVREIKDGLVRQKIRNGKLIRINRNLNIIRGGEWKLCIKRPESIDRSKGERRYSSKIMGWSAHKNFLLKNNY
jgi:hypothetical protein